MTHLSRIMGNYVQNTPYRVTKDSTGKVTSRVRVRDTEYDSKRGDVIESNVVIRLALNRGVATLAINVSEALLAALLSDPVIAAISDESDALKHWSAINAANRTGRATLKPDTTAPGAIAQANALPLDADPESIKAAAATALKAKQASIDAAIARARKVAATAKTTPTK